MLVVTHLPQVAAYADAHVSVTKESDDATTVAHIAQLDRADRVVELTRMLSGQPESEPGRQHAEELLDGAARRAGRDGPLVAGASRDWLARRPDNSDRVIGVARVDHRTKRLVKRVQPGEVMVIDHEDLDRVAAETIVGVRAGAVINAAPSISGRYPNLGPLLVCAAGIPLIDGVGPEVMDAVAEGQLVTVDGDKVLVGGKVIAAGTRQSMQLLEEQIDKARASMGDELERFAENTLSYLSQERHLLLDEPDLPQIDVDMRDRHVLIVVRGAEYRDDLDTLHRSGYLAEMRPLLVGVDGGADALLDLGRTPDIIIGDMDSVTERALRCGALLVVHGYRDGRTPGCRAARSASASTTSCSPPRAPARTSPCCSPTPRAPS